MKKIYKPKIAILIIGVLIVVNVVITAFLSGKSTTYLHLEEEVRVMSLRNRELAENLITRSSLVNIQNESEKLQMSKPQDIIYLSRESTLAKLP